MKSKSKRATIYQVASKAGVAISTVSRVLNNSPNVSDETKEKVNMVISELNFRPQVNARNLASRKPQMLAIATPSFTTPYYNEVLKGVKDQLQEMDLDIVIYNTGSKNPEAAAENFFDRGTADAIIIISISVNDNVHKQIQASGIPTILIGTSHPDYNYFDLNNKLGGFLAGKHLITKGYTRLGMILPAINTKASNDRLEGFKDAIKEYKVPLIDKFFVRGNTTKHAGFTEEAGYEAIFQYKEMGEFPDAVFCSNDTQAIGALHALNKLGMKVPEDIAIMGYDNIKFTKYLDLTTIDQKMYHTGVEATRRLSEIIKNPDESPYQTTINPVLVERNSTNK